MESKRKYGSGRGLVKWAVILPTVCLMLTAGGCGMDDMYTRDWEQWSEETERTVVVLEPEELTATDVSEDVTGMESEDENPLGGCSAEEDAPIYVTISAAGDVTLGNAHTQEYAYSFRQMYDSVEDKGYFLENVLPYFEQDDMTIVNLEGPLTYSEEAREGNTYSIKGDPEYARILTLGSVETVGMANNHRRDYLEQGSKDTVAALEQENIVWAYDGNVGIYETKGIKIGIISVNWVAYGKGIMKFVEKGLQQLEEQGADLKIVSCHWGIEREYLPNADQRELGRQCIDLGADLVLGHHPHVLQGIERYKDRYIVYSMGNFCFGANRNPADKDTLIFQQSFVLEEGEPVRYGEARIIPCSVSSVSKRNDFRPTPAQGEECTRILSKINDLSAYFGVAADEEGKLVAVPATPFPESVESE